ncbi:Subtilase [Trema orientale]|uniref:Subtilase n=1 Tax=Trema orientale TaxID=63057 RepID=A0A2P5FYK2_TREOI|nr:Subtilase [Trema orientale]
MGHCAISSLLLSILLFFLFHLPAEATKKPYIVYLGAHSHGPNPSPVDLESVTSSHHSLLGSYLGSDEKAKDAIFYSYTRHINGFAAILDEAEASEIAKHPKVVSVFLDIGIKLQTTRSWDFLRLERNGVIPYDSIWNEARYGEDTIIGNVDTGVWPESKSFSDEGMGPIPSKWRGICQGGARCNRKLIGARYFNKGYIAHLKALNSTFSYVHNSTTLFSIRDYDGHGTHTLSTAGGNFVPGATVFGNGNGTAKGGSPKARLAAYKVCWPQFPGHGCNQADIIAAFDAAIADGVDVLSVSLGGFSSEYFKDPISIGSFHAVMNGISVVTAAGNDGPDPGTLTNVAPWLLTVGASTIDREFNSYVALGNKKHLKGASLSSRGLPSQKFYPLISGSDAAAAGVSTLDALLCKPGSLDPRKIMGKVLVCLHGETRRTEESQQAALAGAVGMILANDIENGNDIIADPHVLPASHVNFSDGETVFDYLNSTKTPMAYMTRAKTEVEVKPAPLVATFSSRGPNIFEPTILKPDIIAPGVNIIAAYSEANGPADEKFDKRRVPFNVQSGTSMSCPHVSGIVGLLKTLHPDWSPAAIRSAIMTTATTRDANMEPILDASSRERATPFDYGSGHIQPNRAMDPGLVYDIIIDDYWNFLCAHGYNETLFKVYSSNKPHKCNKSFTLANFNYPSISVPSLGSRPVTVARRVKNVGPPGTYKASVRAPTGVYIYVKPNSLQFSKIGEEKNFEIVLKAKVAGKPEDYVFGQLKWSDGKHYVRSPIAVKY